MGLWALEVFEIDDGREPFTEWINDLSEAKFSALDAALRLVLSERGLDLARTEWLKPLGDGVYEFRLRHDEDEIIHMFGSGEARFDQGSQSCRESSSTSTGRRWCSCWAAPTRARTPTNGGRIERSKRPGRTSRAGETVNRSEKAPSRACPRYGRNPII